MSSLEARSPDAVGVIHDINREMDMLRLDSAKLLQELQDLREFYEMQAKKFGVEIRSGRGKKGKYQLGTPSRGGGRKKLYRFFRKR